MDLRQTADELSAILTADDIEFYRSCLKSQIKHGRSADNSSAGTTAEDVGSYKKAVQQGKFHFNPKRELQIINHLRDTDWQSSRDRRYLERRYRKTVHRIENPTAYQRARINRGGCISVWEKRQYQGFKIANDILMVLNSL